MRLFNCIPCLFKERFCLISSCFYLLVGCISSLQVKNEAGKSGDGALVITCSTDGSLGVGGDFELVDAKGGVAGRGNLTWLCRCGGSGNKPFCDGTHKKIGFKSN